MKKSTKRIIATIVLFALLIVALLICVEDENFKEIFVLVISIIGAILVILQIRQSTSTSMGEFILNLQDVYTNNSEYINIFLLCRDRLYKNIKTDEELEKKLIEKRGNLINYLTFFESMYIMLQKKVLKIDLVDDLFGRRFFLVVNNKVVQNLEIINGRDCVYNTNILHLYRLWKKYRLQNEQKNKAKYGQDFYDPVMHTDLKLGLIDLEEAWKINEEKAFPIAKH